MKTETKFLQVNAKERIPTKDNVNYIIGYRPKGLTNINFEIQTANRQMIHWLAKEHNKYDVFWLEPETTDVEENINVNVSDKTKLTFDMETHELIKLPTSAVAEKV